MLLILIALWILWIVIVWSIQHTIMFPTTMIQKSRVLDGPPVGVESIWLRNDDETSVEAWLIPGRGSSRENPGPAVVFAHGNGELIDDNLDLAWLSELGASVLLVEYRGYGRSTGSPSQKAVVRDTKSFIGMLENRPEIDAERIAYMGRSIGTGVLAQAALDHPPSAMIMIVPPARLDTMAWRFGVPPFMVRSPFRTDIAVRDIRSPLLLLPRDRDEIIPDGHAEMIDANAPDSTLIMLHGQHNWLDDGDERIREREAIKSFLESNGVLPAVGDQP